MSNTSGPESDMPSEREKFMQEKEFKERDNKIKEEELSFQREELAVRRDEAKKTFLNNPLSLAIIGATIAAVANVWVAFHNGSEQRAVEATKADNEQRLERQKAEDARIVSAVTGDTAKAIERIRFLLDTHLITDADTRKYIENYINTPQIITPPAITPPTTPPPVTTRRITIDSPRLNGGHSQGEQCAFLNSQLQSQNPGQQTKLVGSSEDSNKDFLGHVTYVYHCTFDITGP